VVGSSFAQFVELHAAAFAFRNPFFGELAALNFLQNFLHLLFGAWCNNAWSACDVAVLGSVADAVTHSSNAFFVHEVNNELHFVQALEVRHLWLVASFNESFETSLNQ
jgi:hypothetical protein